MTLPAAGSVGLAPTRTTLPNGVTVLAKHTTSIPAVTINLAVRTGSSADPVDCPGAMHMLARVIDRGTTTRTPADIAEDLDGRGITLSVGVTRHVLSLACTCLAEDFAPVFALLGDVLMRPSFPDAELATRKTEVATAIRQDEDNPAVRAVESLMAMLYPNGHPYGRLAKGTIEVVEGLTRERLVRLHQQRCAPADLSACIVGDVPVARATEVAAQVFERWETITPSPVVFPAIVPARQRRRLVVPMMSKSQADIACGFVTIPRADKAYYAHWLMNNVLGQYAMGGRLGDSIRERQGMAYYVFSSFDASVVPGPLMIRAGVNPANVDRTVSSIDEEIGRFVRDGVTEKELKESQQYLIGSMPRALETNAGIATFLQTAEFFGLGLDYDLRLPDLLRGVTADAVNEAARCSLDPDRATIVIAGPYEEGTTAA
jgi:zinc protease